MTTQTADIRSNIRTADDTFEQKFNQGDAAGVAALYSSEAMLLPPGSAVVKGNTAIRDFWQGAMNMGIKEAKLDIVEVEQQGDTAIEVGRYRLKGAGGEIMDEGKFIVVWKQEAGQWKLHRDIWNSSRTS
jgi:ketosteroid isomerase-like protein